MMKRSILTIITTVITIAVAACQDQVTVFKDVNVIPMTSADRIVSDQTVLIRGKVVEEMGKTGEVEIPSGATIIDGQGGYLIPGLAEMHAHIPSKQRGDEYIEETLFLYLSNGITTIRGMLGESYHLELREKVSTGEILGPRIFTSGPSLNGNTVKTVQAARSMVTEQKNAGYDFLKLHPGLQMDVFNEIVKTANDVGIPFAGHVSIDVGIRHALRSGYASIDHVDGYVEGLVPEDAGVEPNENGFFGINFTDLADRSRISELSMMTKEHGVWVVPTQSLIERWVGPEEPEELAKDHEMKYMSSAQVDRWVTTKKSYTSNASYSKDLARRFIKLRQDIIKDLHDKGAGILLGSDAPQVFNVPGFSIQNELESMVRSGLTPYQTLESGTSNPAIFFNAKGEFGTIEKGASADLILLNGNPLQNISNTRDQEGIMVRGKWMSKAEIQKRLESIAAKYDDEN